LPVIVKDSPGFLVNRILMPYLIGAGKLFEIGASITEIDEAMLEFGMPMGPLRLLDEVGIDVALHVAKTLAEAYRDRMVLPEILNRMVQSKLLGRKTGCGFYVHPKGKDARPNPTVGHHKQHGIAMTSLQSRMVYLMLNEAARCLEEEIVREPAEVDFAMIMGTGFAPFRGGPLRYADTLGTTKLVGDMERLVEQGLPEFEPCALLRRLAVT
jgi:3-hydroxyacyl-CoA dehydrogenase/enoyl-CoA hydratase/3-hydroxybutyryl-CoA epimerase